MDDRYAPAFCPCGCHAPPPPKPIEPPHEPCCCCEYNPFSDSARESEIQDLQYALRKLTVMKCQMKKWRMERLQLESENRSLKQVLRSLGIDVPLYSRNLRPSPSPPPFPTYSYSRLPLARAIPPRAAISCGEFFLFLPPFPLRVSLLPVRISRSFSS